MQNQVDLEGVHPACAPLPKLGSYKHLILNYIIIDNPAAVWIRRMEIEQRKAINQMG